MLVSIFSCGPSAEETATKEKFKMDSIAKVTETNTRLKIEKEKLLSDSLAALEGNKAAEAAMQEAEILSLKQSLSDANTELRIANEKLSQIKEYTLLRTAAEKEQQINAQYKVIQSWEDEITRLQAELSKYN